MILFLEVVNISPFPAFFRLGIKCFIQRITHIHLITNSGEQGWCSGESVHLPPNVYIICGLSLLLVLVLAPKGFLQEIWFSPLRKNEHFQILIRSGAHKRFQTRSLELLSVSWVNKLH